MAEAQVLGWGTQNAPAQRDVDGHQPWELLSVDATFDGTGAGGDFVPAVQIISDAGVEVGTFPLQSTLTAGDSARVTFAPFLRASTSGTGIQFGVHESGNWLDVTTTSSTGGWGIQMFSTFPVLYEGSIVQLVSDAGKILMDADDDFDLHVRANSGGASLWQFDGAIGIVYSSGVTMTISALTSVQVNDHLGNPIFRIDENGDLHGKTGKALVFDL